MTNITAIAPKKASGEALEFIAALWDAFMENYNAFKNGKMRLEDEVKFNLFSAPGPTQYAAFVNFFGFFVNEEHTLWEGKDYMYMYDFADLDEQKEPALLEFLQNLLSSGYNLENKDITMVSGFFWGQHIPTREKIIVLFKNLHERKASIRLVTRAKKDGLHIDHLPLSHDSHFNISRRMPIHFVLIDPDYLFFELAHTESSVFRLNMFLDLNNLKLKEGKTKADLLNFLDSLIEEAL